MQQETQESYKKLEKRNTAFLQSELPYNYTYINSLKKSKGANFGPADKP